MNLAIETHGLAKRFGATEALTGVDLAVPVGAVYGLLGPNGAGKTTLIRILSTLLRPDAGSARVFGHDVTSDAEVVRGRISLTGQFASLDDDLTALENLRLIGWLRGYSRAHAKTRAGELLEAFGLAAASGRLAKSLSGGMRRRLDLAISLLTRPQLIFLDEPTTGLDPHSRNDVWEMIRGVVVEGTTVLLTTQYLEEADELADQVAVIDHGRVIAEGGTGELKAAVGAGALRLKLLEARQRPQAQRLLAAALKATVELRPDPAALSVSLPADTAGGAVAVALAALARSGIEVVEFSLGQPSLDEVFLSLTGHPRTNANATETDRE